MIDKYTAHSANERTFLAWVRTAISIMVFGFLIEKFDLIMSHTVKSVATGETFAASVAVEIIGILMFLAGVLITITAAYRFFQYKKNIESTQTLLYSVRNSTILLSMLIVVLSLFLLFYMIYEFELDVRLGLSGQL